MANGLQRVKAADWIREASQLDSGEPAGLFCVTPQEKMGSSSPGSCKQPLQASILQHTAEYVYQLEQEKTKLLTQNCHLKRLLQKQHFAAQDESVESPMSKHRKNEFLFVQPNSFESRNSSLWEDLKEELLDLRSQLENERRQRLLSEEKLQTYVNRSTQLHIQYKKQAKDFSAEANSPDGQTVVIAPENVLPDRLPGILEAAINTGTALNQVPANTSVTITQESVGPNSHTIYVANTSRQNLETIVEAIKHLEGDHLFSDEGVVHEEVVDPETQDSPLELTTRTDTLSLLKSSADNGDTRFATSILSNRPGVIVVKQEI